jgi:Tol biopolymer transport system component
MMGGVRTAIVTAAVLLVATGCGTARSSSPAQRHLVYLAGEDPSKGAVWISNVDGSHARSIGRGSAAVLSPDGETVAVLRKGGIYLVSASGKNVRRLTTRRLQPQAWSPDGKTLFANRPELLAVLELDAIDRSTGHVRLVASGSLYGFSFSPKGDELVYSRAPVATGQGPCGDQFDLYVTKVSGGKTTRLTRDGLSGFPVWGREGIAFSHYPAGASIQDCSAPGIWTMDPDGSHVRPVIVRAPEELATNDLFGLQPLAWLDANHILTGVRTNSGNLGAVVDTRTGKLRQLDDFADTASSDGRFAVGSGGDNQGVHVAILQLGNDHRVFLRRSACCPSWNR